MNREFFGWIIGSIVLLTLITAGYIINILILSNPLSYLEICGIGLIGMLTSSGLQIYYKTSSTIMKDDNIPK